MAKWDFESTVSVGWIPVVEDGTPFRSWRPLDYNLQRSMNPVKIYTTEGTAKRYSPAKKAKEVFTRA